MWRRLGIRVTPSSDLLRILTGTAAVCLISNHMTVIRQRVEVPIPRKRTGSTTMHDKGLVRYYETLYQSFLRHIPYASLRAIVIASPGFVKDAIYDYIFDQATKANNKVLLQAKNKFVRVHVSSPHVHSLMEVMKSPEVSRARSQLCTSHYLIYYARFSSPVNYQRPSSLKKGWHLISMIADT